MRNLSLSSCLPLFVITLLSALERCAAADSKISNSVPRVIGDADCDCFLTNGSEPGYYANHMFFDFRSLSSDAGVPGTIANASLAGIAPASSSYFAGEEWTSVWQVQGWNNSEDEAAVLMVNSPANVFVQKNSDSVPQTFLTLRTQRLPGFQSVAEFQTQDADYRFLSLRMLARTTGGPGAVTAMFTYRDAASLAGVQEADVEVLTRGPREAIQYTNQPSYGEDGSVNPAATRNVTVPGGRLWSDWAVHRLDWTPRLSVWYVDGLEVASIAFQVPREASSINFNAWSDGGVWSGNMSMYDEASLQIQWIEVVYNTTTAVAAASNDMTKRSVDWRLRRRNLGPRGALVRRSGNNGKCRVVCSIDEAPETGEAVLLWNSTATRTAGTDMGSRMVWIWSLVVGGVVWFWLI